MKFKQCITTEITFQINYMTEFGELEHKEKIMGDIEVDQALAEYIFLEYAWHDIEDLFSWKIEKSRVLEVVE